MYVTEQFVRIVYMSQTDRRIAKTRKAIYTAFLELLNSKGYQATTVQDIIDRADVGRSTFTVIMKARNYCLTNSATTYSITCLRERHT